MALLLLTEIQGNIQKKAQHKIVNGNIITYGSIECPKN